METSPNKQHGYFKFAYQTGSDIWTHLPYHNQAESMLPNLEPDAIVLDIGAGRGLWMMKLIEDGYRVLGIDYVDSIVDIVNQKIKDAGYQNRARVVVGNAIDIPFADTSFDLVTDVGTFQHLRSEQWDDYRYELFRVLKDHGYYLNISLSRKTQQFLGFHPKTSSSGNFKKFDVDYYFFTDDEIKKIFENYFTILEQQHVSYPSPTEPNDDIVLVFTLMQKK